MLLLAHCSDDTGAGCWFHHPVKEVEWIQVLVSGQGRGGSWPRQSEGGLKDERDCNSVRFTYTRVLGR